MTRERALPQLHGQWQHIEEDMKLEGGEEEDPEELKDFDEKVPEQPYVWGEIWHKQTTKNEREGRNITSKMKEKKWKESSQERVCSQKFPRVQE